MAPIVRNPSTDARYTDARTSWGTLQRQNPGATTRVLQARPVAPSRIAVSVFNVAGSQLLQPDAGTFVTIESNVESGTFKRRVQLASYGFCTNVPAGEVLVSVTSSHTANAFQVSATIDQGNARNEWQTVITPPIAVGDKLSFFTPNYTRRLRVTAFAGSAQLQTTTLGPFFQVAAALPGGATEWLGVAPEQFTIANAGAVPLIASVEWDVFA